MNTLTTESFSAVRYPGGDVWITFRERPRRRDFQPLPLQDYATIVIPKKDCAELAKLLCPATPEQDNKIDYSRCAGEPE